MNNQEMIDHLVKKIMDIERDYINDRFSQDSIAKKTAVNAIYAEVEKVTKDDH